MSDLKKPANWPDTVWLIQEEDSLVVPNGSGVGLCWETEEAAKSVRDRGWHGGTLVFCLSFEDMAQRMAVHGLKAMTLVTAHFHPLAIYLAEGM